VLRLAERKLYTFGNADTWPVLATFIAGKIDEKLIMAHWDDLLVGAHRRRQRFADAAAAQRLSASQRPRVGAARDWPVVLDWLEDSQLRRQTIVELNKGEARNGLARAVSFHRLGRVRDRSAEARQHRASGLTLVTAIIVLWNTVHLTRALDALRRDGVQVTDALLAPLAPLGWRHIQFHGRRVSTLRFGKKISCYLERLV
jgi:TnpA family transposase